MILWSHTRRRRSLRVQATRRKQKKQSPAQPGGAAFQAAAGFKPAFPEPKVPPFHRAYPRAATATRAGASPTASAARQREAIARSTETAPAPATITAIAIPIAKV